MKFVKAKVASTPLVDNVKPEKKPNVVNQMVLTVSPKPIVAEPKARGKSLPKRKRSTNATLLPLLGNLRAN